MASPHPVQATKWDSDISNQYLRIPFEERTWYLSNASLSLDWRKKTSIGYAKVRITNIMRTLLLYELFAIIAAFLLCVVKKVRIRS